LQSSLLLNKPKTKSPQDALTIGLRFIGKIRSLGLERKCTYVARIKSSRFIHGVHKPLSYLRFSVTYCPLVWCVLFFLKLWKKYFEIFS
jgi:hypothetical protein